MDKKFDFRKEKVNLAVGNGKRQQQNPEDIIEYFE
jgi:hypothetical protein